MLNYSDLSTSIQNELLDVIEKNSLIEREYILNVLIFQYVSSQPAMRKFLFITNEREGSTIGEYIDTLIIDNETELVTLTDTNDIDSIEEEYVIGFLLDKINANCKYDVIVLPAYIANNISHNGTIDLSSIIFPNGILLIYGSDELKNDYDLKRVGCYEVDGTTFSAFQRPSVIPSVITDEIQKLVDKIASTDLGNKTALKTLVDDAIKLEDFIQNNRDLYKLHHMCYEANELKNVLLNLYFADKYDPVLELDLKYRVEQLIFE